MKIHNYTQETCGYGHDYTITPIDDGLTADVMGWGRDIEEADIFLLTGPNNGVCFYQVERIEYFNDPPDMFKAHLSYVQSVSNELKEQALQAMEKGR